VPPIWDPVELSFADLDVDDPEEQMGSKDKYWVRLPPDERPWLVKIARTDNFDGTVSGEDWAEWLVQHLAALLGVPTAAVRPATFVGARATVSRSMLRDDVERLIHGNELLSARFPGYDQGIKGENPGYTVQAVRESLEGVSAPAEVSDLADFTAFDVWTGYLLLDAWVSGRDRHHENWGVLRRANKRRLAPSFDHGNALGFQERDERRKRMLDDEAHLMRWLERGRSQHFLGKPLLTNLAHEALRLSAQQSSEYWRERLAAIEQTSVADVIQSVPESLMSDVSRRFVTCLLSTNQRRLMDGYRASQA
jgi:hypothetical protein